MIFRELSLKGVLEVQLEPKEDERGFFMRTYDQNIFAEYGLPTTWVQESHSFSRIKGTIRGLHFQRPPESKLIRVVGGEAFMVFIDLRKNSATFGKSGNVILSAEKKNMLFVPKGFALGMCSLTDNCHLLYKMDVYYHPEGAAGIRWNDPYFGIEWPFKEPKVISEKDANWPLVDPKNPPTVGL